MSYEHDRLSHDASELLLKELRHSTATWATDRLTANTTLWQGMADWPKPDFAFEDRKTKASLAVEFKPPAQPKREYVTAMGQSLTYLQDFEYAAIIVPHMTEDGFNIAQYMKECLESDHAKKLPIGLFGYSKDPSVPGDMVSLIPLRPRAIPLKKLPRGVGRKVFWAYWRDLSAFDLFTILQAMASGRAKDFSRAYRFFWRSRLAKGKALTWEGKARKLKAFVTGISCPDALNARLSLRHIGLIDSTGHLTDEGYRLARLGAVYGPDSSAFMNFIGARVLGVGRHLDLIFWVDEKQRQLTSAQRRTAGSFYAALDKALQDDGIIPTAPSGTGKPTFLRDEQKLWNKLDLLKRRTSTVYFYPDVGLVFNWRNIISVITTGVIS